jgi:ribosomal-protein-alanine N-acetyltransferase
MRVLSGPGVLLEPQMAGHAPELFAVLRDPRVYRYLDTEPPADEASLRARLVRLEARRSPDGAEVWLNWVVRNPAGVLVGYVQATVASDQSADIGYVLGAAHWRRGYGGAAVATMLDELRTGYGVTRLRATVECDNEASRRLLERLGFAAGDDAPGTSELQFVRSMP